MTPGKSAAYAPTPFDATGEVPIKDTTTGRSLVTHHWRISRKRSCRLKLQNLVYRWAYQRQLRGPFICYLNSTRSSLVFKFGSRLIPLKDSSVLALVKRTSRFRDHHPVGG